MGRRIVIMGPSNAGKSTLCVSLAIKLAVTAVHLDQLRHLPGTDWQQRSDREFRRLHDQAIKSHAWIMDGNYSALLPQRLARATGIIVLDDHYTNRFGRYLRRTLFQADRKGSLQGNKDSIKWDMIQWIWKTRHSADRYIDFAQTTGLPTVVCRTLDELRILYTAWDL